jgi:hypothetical protein
MAVHQIPFKYLENSNQYLNAPPQPYPGIELRRSKEEWKETKWMEWMEWNGME